MPYARTGHGDIHYDTIDLVAPWRTDAQTIVFCHGIGGDPGIWAQWIPVLAERHRLVRYELRGYGRSEAAGRDVDWSLELLSDDVIAIADAVGASRFHVVGESFGGTIAMHTAIAHPDRVRTLTVSNGAHLGTSIERADAWRAVLDRGGVKAWSDRLLDDRFHPGAIDDAQRAWFARCQEAWPRETILAALSVLVGTDLRPGLETIACPVLLLHGDASPFIPVAVMAELHAQLPGSELQVVAHARHGVPFSHAVQCASTLLAFLSRHEPQGR